MAVTINVNGAAHSVDVDGDTPLLWVLRDVLGMTGTKFGCGMALCGACTVHIDGAATRSCITAIESIGNSPIMTIEAIGGPLTLSSLPPIGLIERKISPAADSYAPLQPLAAALCLVSA